MVISTAVNTFGGSTPPAEAFSVLPSAPSGPQITPYLQYQTQLAWREDEKRMKVWDGIRTEQDLLRVQKEIHQKLLTMLGGLPTIRTPLNSHVTGRIAMDGFYIEKLIFESLPGVYVTALLYVPDEGNSGEHTKHPAVLVAAGHAENGKAHYQPLCQRLVQRGYVVISWDPVGQGERSQFWDAKAGRNRYNRICAEHAVLGNLAYLAGTNLARWEIWDGLRAFDYLLTRPEVDPERINITGTSGGGFQAMHIAALEPRLKVAAISCYITSLPMRIHNRIFKDPDSDPEQDLYGMISNGVDHAGLLLLMYPRPVFVAAATLDFFPIEGTHKTFQEVSGLYRRFGHADRIAMAEGYHGHQYSDENQKAAFEFLDHFNQLPERHALASAKDLDEKTVQCTRSGQVMLDFEDARSLMDLIRDYYTEHQTSTAQSIRQLYLGRNYPGIATWNIRQYSGVAPAESEIAWESAGASLFEDASIDRYVLRHSGGLLMPLLHIHRTGNQNRRWLLWFSKNGKAGVNDWPEIRKYLDAGFDIVTFDSRGLGETRMPYKAVSEDDPSFAQLDFDRAYVNPLSSVLADYVYNSVLTGRPYFLQMIEDAEIAVHFSRSKLHAEDFSVASDEEGFTLASALAEVLPRVKQIPYPGAPIIKWSDLLIQKREQWPIQYLLPGGAYIH
ncbi:MAG TPA: acetylxylan esterase [Candidatus Sulfotelmatobacter sp.]|nr:acetylxylan esterase [Candidatus Sulfotelmatobacter sp.]